MCHRLASRGIAASLVLPAVVLATGRPAAGFEAEPLSLRQAIERAVTGNVDLQRERINIESAGASFLASHGSFDFLVNGGLTFSRTTTPALGSSGDFISGVTNRLDYNAGISRNLETGGSVGLTVTGALTNSNSLFQCGMMVSKSCSIYTDNLALNFKHPLLRGFGRDIAQAQIRRGRIQQDLALLNRQTRASNIIRDVTSGYWELAYATQELAILRSAVDLAREQLKFTQAQIEVGRAAPLEAAAAQRAIADREQQVALSEQGLFFRTLDLRRQLGLPADATTINYIASDVPEGVPHEVDMAGEIRKSLESNPQLRSLRMGLKLNEVDLQTAAANLKPQLDFTGSFGSAGRSGDLPGALNGTVGLDNVTWSAGLAFSMPIENRAARGNQQVTELAAKLARLNAGDYELVVRDTVIRLAMSIKTASRRLELAREAVGYAAKDLEAEQARFNVGRSTNNEILRRQQDLKAAQIQVVRATVDLLNSENQLAAMTGEVLDRNGVALKTM